MKKFAFGCFVVALLTGAAMLGGKEVPQLPVPEKEHEWLGQLAGEWETEGEAFLEPGKPPIKCQGTESARRIGGFWIVAENKGTFMDVPVTGVLTLGYDPQKKKYVGTWIDSVSNYLWSYEGTVDAGGKTLTLETEGPSHDTPGKLAKFKEVIEVKTDDHKVFTSSVQGEDGKWSTIVTIHYRRKKAVAGEATQNQPPSEQEPVVAGNRIVHFEITADQPETLTKFYGELFGWKFQKAAIPDLEYWLCDTGSGGPGINGAVMQRQNAEQPWMNYVDVASIDAALEKATKLGAQVALPKTPVPGVGAVAAIVDPQGNVCGLWEAARP
ncbi:MAG: DUF1579 family protein [Pirellulales bacterium]